MTDSIYTNAASQYGEISFKGKSYALLETASLTNRLFDGGWTPELQEGDEYISEWSAPAIGQDGEEYVVTWKFDAVKGQEPEDDSNWPWGKVHSVEAV